MTKTFELHDAHGKKATITIDAPMIVSAEQNIVVLDAASQPVAVIEMQPGIDRKQL